MGNETKVTSADRAARDKDKPLSEGETRELVERVAWEVVPHLAEALIREELKRQLGEN